MQAAISANLPLKIDQIHVEGNNQTRKSLIENRLANCLNGKTVAQIAEEVVNGTKRLWDLDVFETLSVELQPSQRDSKNIKLADIYVKVKEKRILSAKASTYVSPGDPSGGTMGAGGEGTIRILNALGLAESVEMSYTSTGAPNFHSSSSLGEDGTAIKPSLFEARKNKYNIEYSQPEPFSFSNVLFQASADQTSSKPHTIDNIVPYTELSKGFAARLSLAKSVFFVFESRNRDILPDRSVTPTTNHNNNEAIAIQYDVPGELLALAKPSTKSSVAIEYVYNNQTPTNAIPLGGSTFFKSKAELAKSDWFGGDVDLFAVSSLMRMIVPIINNNALNFSLSLEGSMVRNLNHSKKNLPLFLSDRLFLGGPIFLRGFPHRSVGGARIDRKLCLGGDTRWQMRCALEGLPQLLWSGKKTASSSSSYYLHSFVTCGSLVNAQQVYEQPVSNNWLKDLLFSDVKLACGLGIITSFSKDVRLEINLTFPLLWNNAHDYSRYGKFRPALEFGIGGEFL